MEKNILCTITHKKHFSKKKCRNDETDEYFLATEMARAD